MSGWQTAATTGSSSSIAKDRFSARLAPGHGPGQFAWAHFLAIGADRKIYVADVLNWRFQVFAPTPPTGRMASYVPSTRRFWDSTPSAGWFSRQANLPKK